MRTPPPRRTALLVAAGLAIVLPVYLVARPWDLRDGLMIGAPFGRDFVNFWLGGRLALDGSLATLADVPAYDALVARLFGHDAADVLVFSYPPHILLALAPLAALPYPTALVVWTALNLLALAAATRLLAARAGGIAVAACLSPAALTMVIYGHFGGLLALALAGIVTGAARRPLVAGLCLAALTVKPQLALVVGAALLLGGRWRCVAVSACATALLLALSVAVFGIAPWRAFLAVTLPEQGRMLADFEAGMLGTTISPFLAARALGVPAPAAWLAQAVAAGAAMLAAARALRRGDAATSHLAVALAAVTALPYANGYDLALAAPALTPIVLAGTGTGPGTLARLARLARLALWLAPPLAWARVDGGVPIVPLAAAGTLLALLPRPGALRNELFRSCKILLLQLRRPSVYGTDGGDLSGRRRVDVAMRGAGARTARDAAM